MPDQNGNPSGTAATLEPRDDLRLTRHHLRIGGVHVPYTATAGTMVLREESFGKGEQAEQAEGLKARAEVFVVSYVRDDVKDVASRPVTFCFNGGPGSSSVWLHLGMLGPKRVDMGPEGFPTRSRCVCSITSTPSST